MISDEMRELLSTYVDGELTDKDAVRVEDMSKRDPELRREIEAYRILGRQLKEWDAAEKEEIQPSSEIRERALHRVRAYVRVTGHHAVNRFGGVWALAAGLLIAVGLGVVLGSSGDAPGPVVAKADDVLPAEDYRPYESVAADKSVVTLREFQNSIPEFEPFHPRLKAALPGRLIDGKYWPDKAISMLIDWDAQHRQMARVVRDHPDLRKETRTGTGWRQPIMMMVSGYEPASAPVEGLVVLRHQVGVDTLDVDAVPAGADIAEDNKYESDALLISTGRLAKGPSRLLLAGEVFLGSRDKSNRRRVVRASSYVVESSYVPMTWADKVAIPENFGRLVLQSEMLGPKTRHALVRGKALPKDAVEALEKNRKVRAAAVERLMGSLERDAGATGFAVLARNKVLGVELFASHELMLAYAPRLLHGYLAEAGVKAVRLTAPTRGADLIQKLARKLIDRVSENADGLRDVRDGTTDEWPKERGKPLLRRVNVMAGPNAIAGHGLLYKGRPLHVTLFGE